ncbi:MAG TPA: hypothetical protein VF232_11285 [Gaiellaceae bacterium]
MRLALSALAAALLVAAAAGCGGKQATTTAAATHPTALPTQSPWAKQVDVVCKPWQDRIDAIRPPPTTVASLQKWLARALPVLRKQIAAVEKVPLPESTSEARKVRRLLDSLNTTERALTRYLAAVNAKAQAKAQAALTSAATAGAKARALSLSLDITRCGGYSIG